MSRPLFVVTVCLCAWATPMLAQGTLISDGGCSVSATGLESCSWVSTLPRTRDLFVSQYRLAADAPLTLPLAPYDAIVVTLDDGILLNESAGLLGVPINAYKGMVLLVRKDEHVLLRNKSGHELKVVVIENR